MKRKVSLSFLLLLIIFAMEMTGGIRWIYMPFRSGMFMRNISGYISYAGNLIQTLAPLVLMVLLHFNQKKPMAKFAGLVCLLAAAFDLFFAAKGVINLVRWAFAAQVNMYTLVMNSALPVFLQNLFIGLGFLKVGLELFTNTKSKGVKGLLIFGAFLIIFVGLLRTVGHRPVTEMLNPLLTMLAVALLTPAYTDRSKCTMVTVKSIIAILVILGLLMVLPELINGSSNNSSSSNRCTICGKTATNTFQGSRYCTQHYKDAIIWAMDNVSRK